MTDLLVPVLLLLVSCHALHKKRTSILCLCSARRMVCACSRPSCPRLSFCSLPSRCSVRAAASLFDAPVFSGLFVFGIPSELVPLMLVRPLSGSAALAVGAELMRTHGVDSLIGRTAAVMLGSTETTFYTISVYFGAAGVRRTRYTLPAACIADLTGFLSPL